MSAVAATDDRRNMTPFDEVVFEIDELYDEAALWNSDVSLAPVQAHTEGEGE